MKFVFSVIAADGEELRKAIDEVVEQFFPIDKWNRAPDCIEQNHEASGYESIKKGKKTVKVMILVWNVTVEVYPKGLDNCLVKVKTYMS